MESSAGAVPLDDPDDLALVLFAMATDIVRQVPRDTSLTSISTLATLARVGPRRITELAAAEGISQPSMTVLVAALEDAGHVARASDPTDRRASLVSLTDEGRDYVRRRRAAGSQNVADVVDRLSVPHRAALTAALPALHVVRELIATQRDPTTPQRDPTTPPRDDPPAASSGHRG